MEYVFNLLLSLNSNFPSQQNEKKKPSTNDIDTPIYSKNGNVISHNLGITQECFQPKIGENNKNIQQHSYKIFMY